MNVNTKPFQMDASAKSFTPSAQVGVSGASINTPFTTNAGGMPFPGPMQNNFIPMSA